MRNNKLASMKVSQQKTSTYGEHCPYPIMAKRLCTTETHSNRSTTASRCMARYPHPQNRPHSLTTACSTKKTHAPADNEHPACSITKQTHRQPKDCAFDAVGQACSEIRIRADRRA